MRWFSLLLCVGLDIAVLAQDSDSPVRGSILECFEDNENLRKNTTEVSRFRTDQEFELNFHLEEDRWRQSSDFVPATGALFRSMGLGEHDFEGQVVVDLGGGSRLRTAYFEGARLVVVEPMAAHLLPHVTRKPHIDIGDSAKVWQLYAMPAEYRACAVEGTASLVVAINMLDHSWWPEKIMRNAELLLRPCDAGASLLVVSVDLKTQVTIGHPHVLTRRWFREVVNGTSLKLVRAFQQQLTVYDKLQFTYGDGIAWTFMFSRRCKLEPKGTLKGLELLPKRMVRGAWGIIPKFWDKPLPPSETWVESSETLHG